MPDPSPGVPHATKEQEVRRLLREIRELATRHHGAGGNEAVLRHDLQLIGELTEELEQALRTDRAERRA